MSVKVRSEFCCWIMDTYIKLLAAKGLRADPNAPNVKNELAAAARSAIVTIYNLDHVISPQDCYWLC